MFLTVLTRTEGTATARRASWWWPWPVLFRLLIVLAGTDATLGLFALWGHTSDAKPTAVLLVVLTWLVALLAVVAVKLRAA